MKKLFLVLFLFTLLALSTCDENPVNGDNITPGRRDYMWTVDTLFMPFNSFTDITGTSPTDVWVCGPGGDLDKTFYHYNGQSWKSDLIPRPFAPLSISNISYDNVWSGGRTGMIWNFNGSQWSQKYQHDINGNYDITFQSIKVVSSSKIIAGGYYFISPDYWGIILSSNGVAWEQLNIPKIRTTFADIKVSDNGEIYLWGITNEQFTESRYQFYELEGSNLREIYSGSQSTDEEYGTLLQLGNRTYFIIGYDFFSFNGSKFSKIGRLYDDTKFLNVGWGRNEKDIFLGMRDGIAHYNGENTVYLYQSTENILVREGIVFESDVFFVGRDSNGNNLMIHGKLNEQ